MTPEEAHTAMAGVVTEVLADAMAASPYAVARELLKRGWRPPLEPPPVDDDAVVAAATRRSYSLIRHMRAEDEQGMTAVIAELKSEREALLQIFSLAGMVVNLFGLIDADSIEALMDRETNAAAMREHGCPE